MFTPKTRVAITDDSADAISGMLQYLQADPSLKLSGVFGDGMATLHGLNGNHTDILLLGDHLIRYGRRNLVTDLHYLHPTLRIVLLLSERRFDADPVRAALRKGVRACLIIPDHNDILLAAIHAVRQGNLVLPDEVRDRMDEAERSKIKALTAQELTLLDLISDEYKPSEIALELNIDPESAEQQCRDLLNKMQVDTFAGLVRAAIAKGLL